MDRRPHATDELISFIREMNALAVRRVEVGDHETANILTHESVRARLALRRVLAVTDAVEAYMRIRDRRLRTELLDTSDRRSKEFRAKRRGELDTMLAAEKRLADAVIALRTSDDSPQAEGS